jgi:glyoxylase-like metal-dependent hydrolase (beta-lactamase superfamily II)
MAENEIHIYPLDLGTILGIDKSIFTRLLNYGEKINVHCIGWLIQGAEKTILVDTGPCDPETAARYHHTLQKSKEQEINSALLKIGVSTKDIDIVIFTHLHWDHCYNLEFFNDAAFVVQKKEIMYAVGALPYDRTPYEIKVPGIQPPWMSIFDRLSVIDGDQEIIPGISVISLPGHTPGSQGVVIETADGEWVIAGDNFPLYDNRVEGIDFRYIPSGVYQNLFDCYSSLKRLEIYGDRVLPGHDEIVFEKDKYPF